jgi:hypothetical protein
MATTKYNTAPTMLAVLLGTYRRGLHLRRISLAGCDGSVRGSESVGLTRHSRVLGWVRLQPVSHRSRGWYRSTHVGVCRAVGLRRKRRGGETQREREEERQECSWAGHDGVGLMPSFELKSAAEQCVAVRCDAM